MFRVRGNEFACVIVEPIVGNMGCVPPDPGYLKLMRDVTARHGAVLIFDEVMTGFRVAVGGAQQLYDIRPDLTTLGKVIGGGLPVGAYGGRADIAEQGRTGRTGVSGRHAFRKSTGGCGRPCGIATPGTPEALRKARSRSGVEALERGLTDAMSKAGVVGSVNRVGSMFTLFFTDRKVVDFTTAKTSATRFDSTRTFKPCLKEELICRHRSSKLLLFPRPTRTPISIARSRRRGMRLANCRRQVFCNSLSCCVRDFRPNNTSRTMSNTPAPYGSWKSPITTSLLTSAGVSIGQIELGDDCLYWSEGRPMDGGRVVIVRRTHDGVSNGMSHRHPFNARSRVHEYGGGSYTVRGNSVLLHEFCRPANVPASRRSSGSQPHHTRSLPQPASLRYADARVTPPQRSHEGRQHPRSRHPVVAAIPISPVSRHPNVSCSRTNRLLIHK